MEIDNAIGLIIAIVLPVVLYAVWMRATVKVILHQNTELLDMHRDPTSLFATQETNQMINQNRTMVKEMTLSNQRLLRELIHYMRWHVQQQNGKAPPPYVDG